MRLIFSDLTYPKLGGGQNLIFNVVRNAFVEHNIMSVLIGSQESSIIKRLNEHGIPYAFYRTGNVSDLTTDQGDRFIHFHYFDGLRELKGLPGKCLVWGILAGQMTGWNRFGFEKRLIGKRYLGNFFTRRFLLGMRQGNALLSMDGATSDAINQTAGRDLDLPILPVPIDTQDVRPVCYARPPGRPLTFSYIGRSDDVWKIKPVKKMVRDLSRFVDQNCVVNIYTDDAQPFLEDIDLPSNSTVAMNFYTGFYGSKLRDHIADHSDIHFSMGTAALEGALSGIATILIDYGVNDFHDTYRYRWLYDTEQCSLGRCIDGEIYFEGMTIQDLMAVATHDASRHEVAKRCQQHVLKHHGVNVITERLLAHPTEATNRDVCRLTPATWSGARQVASLLNRRVEMV